MGVPEWIDEIRRDPKRLHTLSPREFEELVAELLASFGWEVSLTPPTRDGGHDILAISRDPSGLETAWAVECKHYEPDRPVGVEVIRELYAVKHGLRLPQALLVTTSRPTRGAKEFADTVGDVKIADQNQLLGWLSQYRRHFAIDSSHLSVKRFHSCFLSYSHKDEEFANHLVARLRNEGIRLWFAPEDLTPGTKINEEITKAIESFDRLIVVLSENSIRSPWVQSELRKARRRELRDGCRVLFPISLVPFEMLKAWELFDADAGQDLAAELRGYLIPDFSGWQDSEKFDQQVAALIKGLAAA